MFLVTVYNNNGSSEYKTHNDDVTYNYIMGNDPMIKFRTVEGTIICLPNTVIIEQKKIDDR